MRNCALDFLKMATSKKIRVLRVITRMNLGGPSIQVNGLLRELNLNEFQQLLVFGNLEAHEKENLASHNYVNYKKSKYLSRTPNLFRDALALFELRSIMKEFEPDIIHTHTSKAGLLGRLAALTLSHRPKIVHTFHGHVLHGYFGFFKRKLIIFIESKLARRSDAIITMGKRVGAELEDIGIVPPTKLIPMYPGLDKPREYTKASAKQILGMRNSSLNVAWIGRLVEIKRPNRVIEIARELKAVNPNIRICVAGEGPELPALQAISKKEDLPVDFLGWVTDIGLVISASELVFQTSASEGTPLALIQAQMLGRPVIATPVGSINEIMINSETGVLIDYCASAFSEVMVDLIESKNLMEEMGNKARLFADERFSVTVMCKRHARLYKELVNPKNDVTTDQAS